MADDTLNNNPAVRTWHESAQRPGFKFLVVQIVCQLTGGPHVYTGRPMDKAHKHLNIKQDQWDKFMELFNEVCEACGLSLDMVGDLNALMISMEDECVVQPGETVPPKPGPYRPSGSTFYARLGGVYPIAQFADRLVDALLADDRVHIPTDDHKRNEASLKYLFTELICSAAGGPEVRTSPEAEETYLLIPKAEWPILVATANVAADHFDTSLRPSLIQLLQAQRPYIVDPASPDQASMPSVLGAAVVKDLRASAAGVKQATRALGHGASVAARLRVFGDPRTLYGRGGGVFGLAKLTNRLMDTWMANPVLNANASVAKWHESQQSSGFKFLVTQLMGYLTGGPQRYTGQSMETAHRHLGINNSQWQSFVGDAQRVFAEFQLNNGVQHELLDIIQSFQTSCTVRSGEEVPPDLGRCRQKPNGASNYANLGGVYPIALFVDRLVEEVLKGDRVVVQWDRLDSPGVRHPPGLKYMLTELLCNSLGGPEMVTCKGFEEAKLGVKVEQWDRFVELAGNVASMWPTLHHRGVVAKGLKRPSWE
jgi:hemoglobin